ncbi:MAG: 16S rRNA (guanine(527)-N(7))-methyltransferase RsmG [Bacteroidota bacterium]
MEEIKKYFPDLSPVQYEQLEALGRLYPEWNNKINVISRKDIENLYRHHILHSLAVAKFISFKPEARVLDLGTGGGFPGIPLAILFPETTFTLIDGTRKKIMVVNEVRRAIGLDNCHGIHIRAEEHKAKYDFVVSRAVAHIEKLTDWSFRLIRNKQLHAMPNGLITLKGGNIKEELRALPKTYYSEKYPLTSYFDAPFFEEKFLIYVQY